MQVEQTAILKRAMKSRLASQIPAFFLITITALATMNKGFAQADMDQTSPRPNPRYAATPYGAYQPAPPAIDPVTGMGMKPPGKPWKDENWKDPDKVLPEVSYDGKQLYWVARNLREEFKDAFDVIIPRSWQDPNASGWHDPNIPVEPLEPGANSITMHLKNVTASEVFNAMNMIFEGENSPYRWELRMNGKRPTAILRVLPQLLPAPQNLQPPPKLVRTVFFVGDFIGDKSGGMSIEQLAKTVTEIYRMSGQFNATISFHEAAQLLIVSGTDDDIQFIQRTLSAIRSKVHMEQNAEAKPAESRANEKPAKPR